MIRGVIAWAGYPQNLWISLGIKGVSRGRDSGMTDGEKRGRDRYLFNEKSGRHLGDRDPLNEKRSASRSGV